MSEVNDRNEIVRDAPRKGPKGAPVDTTRDDAETRGEVIREYPRSGPKGEPVDTTRNSDTPN